MGTPIQMDRESNILASRKHDIDDIIDSKITIHDSRHFEIRLQIDLPESRSSTYEVESYFFVPKSLNVAPGNYSKHDFYSGIHKYIRFKTPQIALDKITDKAVTASPWNKLKQGVESLLLNSVNPTQSAIVLRETIEEIKLLGQVIRRSLRDTTMEVIRQINHQHDPEENLESQSALFAATHRLLRDVHELTNDISSLRLEIFRPQLPDKVRDAYRFFDEFYSLTIEDHLSLMYKDFQDKSIFSGKCLELRKEIEEVLLQQQKHRASMLYPSLIQKGSDNSILPYRKGVLKKFTSSSLYLNLEQTEWQFLAQLNFSIAAGLAMLFAAIVTIFAQNRFSTSSSMFVVIVVVSYILKDRMKDWMKVFLSQRMLRGVADFKTRILDPGTQQVVGVFREAFAFIEPSKIPDVVRNRRNIDNITSIDVEGKPERVMKYEKQVTLYPKKISKFHQRRRDINDIMRFDISQWVKHADDPNTNALHFDGETNTMQVVPCSKVYHINIVFRYQSLGSDGKMRDTLERIRLVLNHQGIVQLEEVR